VCGWAELLQQTKRVNAGDYDVLLKAFVYFLLRGHYVRVLMPTYLLYVHAYDGNMIRPV
jgi:hypothetical protein